MRDEVAIGSGALLLALAATALSTSAWGRMEGTQAKAVAGVVRQSMEDWHLRAVSSKSRETDE